MDASRRLPYFSPEVDSIVGGYLAKNGFSTSESTVWRVTYRRDGVILSLAYHVEDLPAPFVAVDVGLARDDGTSDLLGLWRALAADEAGRRYTSWTFHDQASLEQLLHRIVAEVLVPHAPRLWQSPDILADLLRRQAVEVESRYLEDRHGADVIQARRAFDEGRFQDAIDGFVLTAANSLSAGDRRRLVEARRRVLKGPSAPDVA